VKRPERRLRDRSNGVAGRRYLMISLAPMRLIHARLWGTARVVAHYRTRRNRRGSTNRDESCGTKLLTDGARHRIRQKFHVAS
jgi:hypothetical protein